MTNMTERACILVVGAENQRLAANLDVLRNDGWTVLGTSDAWEAISLVSQREFGMILLDLDLAGLRAMDFARILSEDPSLNSIPMMNYFGDCRPEELLRAVRTTMPTPFPAEESVKGGTRFVRRRRTAAVPA